MNRMIETADWWALEQGDALAVFAENEGVIVDDEHRVALVSLIEERIEAADCDLSWAEAIEAESNLRDLCNYVQNAELGLRLEHL